MNKALSKLCTPIQWNPHQLLNVLFNFFTSAVLKDRYIYTDRVLVSTYVKGTKVQNIVYMLHLLGEKWTSRNALSNAVICRKYLWKDQRNYLQYFLWGWDKDKRKKIIIYYVSFLLFGFFSPGCVSISYFIFLKYILLIMLLQLSHFFLPFIPLHPAPPLPPASPPISSCSWVIHISSLASPFPILFLPSPCLFSIYHLCYLFSVPFPTLSPSQSPIDNPPCDLHFCGSVSVLVVGLVFFCFGFRCGC